MTAADTHPTRTPATLTEARRALRQGAAVVVPNPAPLTHVVTATAATAVNRAKGRPVDQPVALWAHHRHTLDTLTGLWDLSPGHAALVLRLLAEEHLTVLVAERARAARPPWLEPAVKDGWMLLFGARWQPLHPLLDDHSVLYVSSANATGRPPAAHTAGALAMFPPTVPVLHLTGAEPASTPTASPTRRATTTVRVMPGGQLHLHRHGAQDLASGRPDDYLRLLSAQYSKANGTG
ncbi:hypothetical protein ACFQ7Z_04225 [Streptomyces virginiae]|uniref:hypothetical protein n=1 Tax=Streptomyces virginiae TaxID=1961 RepID=UPI0036A53013